MSPTLDVESASMTALGLKVKPEAILWPKTYLTSASNLPYIDPHTYLLTPTWNLPPYRMHRRSMYIMYIYIHVHMYVCMCSSTYTYPSCTLLWNRPHSTTEKTSPTQEERLPSSPAPASPGSPEITEKLAGLPQGPSCPAPKFPSICVIHA